MDLQTRKIQFVQAFLKLQSEQAISRLEKILQKETQISEQDNFRPMSISAFNDRIDQSMQDSQSGRIIEAEELKAKMDKWG